MLNSNFIEGTVSIWYRNNEEIITKIKINKVIDNYAYLPTYKELITQN